MPHSGVAGPSLTGRHAVFADRQWTNILGPQTLSCGEIPGSHVRQQHHLPARQPSKITATITCLNFFTQCSYVWKGHAACCGDVILNRAPVYSAVLANKSKMEIKNIPSGMAAVSSCMEYKHPASRGSDRLRNNIKSATSWSDLFSSRKKTLDSRAASVHGRRSQDNPQITLNCRSA